MHHLFLTSSIAIEGVGESIRARLGHNNPLKTVFINTPVEGEIDQSDLSWVEEERVGLNKNGFVTFDYTITDKVLAQIKADLADIDILYISGGNEFYLKEKINESGFGSFVKDFVDKGGLYIGTSCGSIIVGNDMSALQKLSDLDKLSKPIDCKGLGLVNFTILPHWGSSDFRDRWLSKESFDVMFNPSTPLIALNNYQYIEMQGDSWQIIDVRKEL